MLPSDCAIRGGFVAVRQISSMTCIEALAHNRIAWAGQWTAVGICGHATDLFSRGSQSRRTVFPLPETYFCRANPMQTASNVLQTKPSL